MTGLLFQPQLQWQMDENSHQTLFNFQFVSCSICWLVKRGLGSPIAAVSELLQFKDWSRQGVFTTKSIIFITVFRTNLVVSELGVPLNYQDTFSHHAPIPLLLLYIQIHFYYHCHCPLRHLYTYLWCQVAVEPIHHLLPNTNNHECTSSEMKWTSKPHTGCTDEVQSCLSSWGGNVYLCVLLHFWAGVDIVEWYLAHDKTPQWRRVFSTIVLLHICFS